MNKEKHSPRLQAYERCALPLLAILLFALLLRLPYLFSGLPYLYDEDEAHHLNRLFEMVKTDDLNPHYFHKPSLHFYLRLPVVYGMVIYKKARSEMSSSKNIRTRDQYGLAGYAFSTSHPSLVVGARAVSLALSLGLILLTFLIIRSLQLPPFLAYSGAMLCAVAPPLVEHSCLIAVDTPMAFFCLAATLSALYATHNYSHRMLLLCSILAGFAISTKYNAAPIAVLPLLIWWFVARKIPTQSRCALLIALLIPGFAFLLASPFIVIEFNEFWQQLRYEVWHYSVAGHEGNSGERGIPQLLFYSSWFTHEAVGYVASIGALLGFIAALKKRSPQLILLLAFPALYLLLMVLQKVHFTRNMVVMIPYLAVLCVYLLAQIKRPLVAQCVVVLALLQPLRSTLPLATAQLQIPESRKRLESFLKTHPAPLPDIAISGGLQPALTLSGIPGVSVVNFDKVTLESLYNHGYDWIVVPGGQISELRTSTYALNKVISLPGAPLSRVIKNPEIDLLAFDKEFMKGVLLKNTRTKPVTARVDEQGNVSLTCPQNGCALSTRFTPVIIQKNESGVNRTKLTTLHLTLSTPWSDQQVSICDKERCQAPVMLKAGVAQEVVLILTPEMITSGEFTLQVYRISSPREHGLGRERARVGVNITKAQLY